MTFERVGHWSRGSELAVAITLGFVQLGLFVLLLPAALSGRLTLSGTLYTIASAACIAGVLALVATKHRRVSLAIIAAAFALAGSVAAARALQPGPGGGFENTRRASAIAEQDMNVVAATWLPLIGSFERHENEGFAAAVARLGQHIEAKHGDDVSRARSGETLLFSGPERPRGTVIFLHGYGGNVSSFCWVVADAARANGWETVCPSCGFSGAWWREASCESEVARLLRDAREAGSQYVVLAGLSNGGVGASTLASRGLEVDGVVLISGITALPPTTGPSGEQESRVMHWSAPTLVIYGAMDRRFSTGHFERFAAEHPNTVAIPMPFGHFLLAKNYEAVQAKLTRWLSGLR